MPIPGYFKFNDILQNLDDISSASETHLGLYDVATAISRSIIREFDITHHRSTKALSEEDFDEIERVTNRMVFITFCAEIEQLMLDLYKELLVYEAAKNAGLSEDNAKIARTMDEVRNYKNIDKPSVINLIQKKLFNLFSYNSSKRKNLDDAWKYILKCYKTRDVYIHGRKNVGDDKKNFRLRSETIPTLAKAIKQITKSVRKSLI